MPIVFNGYPSFGYEEEMRREAKGLKLESIAVSRTYVLDLLPSFPSSPDASRVFAEFNGNRLHTYPTAVTNQDIYGI